ncbi:6-phospho-beta-glucosidase [Povalibacter uvarum]|uniref:6-phospho-beta-glucosidase n=1 Tax=Povalibacter uvarum TaxID=732238 RepID=A0A841HTY0_9GAMM|nr:6-phospho-beta-glucosidase [Povalibacter uvarum]MBB6095442.1 6-phospho-beta-glucosidase [Povalibacter uvarum]
MRELKVCVVGAGGSYTPEIVEGLITHRSQGLNVRVLGLCDTNRDRLEVMAGLARRMIDSAGADIEVQVSQELGEAARDADFVVTQIRVGGMQARRIDEVIPAKYGIIGQETTGPGGMFKALRTIPVMLDVARVVTEVAPRAFILNYTNPSGVVTEAVLTLTRARLLGLCSSIPLMQVQLRKLLQPRFGDVRIHSVGLNHLGFIFRIVAKEADVTSAAISWARRNHGGEDSLLTSALEVAETIGAIPVPKYGDLYFHRRREVKLAAEASRTRADVVMDIEAAVLKEAADPHTVGKPAALLRRGGDGYSSVTFSTMLSIVSNRGDDIVMSAMNRGAVSDLPDNVVVETNCRVDALGANPIPVGSLPLAIRGLVQAVKTHETLTVQAAVTKRRDLALQALLAHPLVSDIDVAVPLLDEMLQAHGLEYH